MMKKRTLSVFLLTVMSAGALSAQNGWYVNGGLESNSIYYADDYVTGAERPDGGVGSNNYFKLDLSKGCFSAGFQAEGYFPALQGYPEQMNGLSLATKYVKYSGGNLTATVGDFYDQFGSGLLFRAYEERSLGINTAIEGAHVAYNLKDAVQAKAFVGVPKKFKAYNFDSRLTGVDLVASISSLVGTDAFGLTLEGSFLNKHQALESEWMKGMMEPDINGVSTRISFDWQGLTLKGEYVARTSDVCVYNNFNTEKSRAILLEGAFTRGAFGMNVTLRKISNAGFQSDHNESTIYTSLNYIPALTQQHSYSLASLNPYQSQMSGEFGGQADVFYFFPRRTLIGGPKGMKFHANFSTYYGPSPAPEIKKNELYFRDLTFDAERWFGSKVKAIVLYTWQTYNNRVGVHPSYEFRRSHTVVGNVTYKFDRKQSLRAEYQHLWSRQGDGNWCAGTLEYTISPGWDFSISDMWNYGYTRTHYFNGGVAYSWSRTRAALNFGRFREGYLCAGGVCRLIPAYTGANLTITTSF